MKLYWKIRNAIEEFWHSFLIRLYKAFDAKSVDFFNKLLTLEMVDILSELVIVRYLQLREPQSAAIKEHICKHSLKTEALYESRCKFKEALISKFIDENANWLRCSIAKECMKQGIENPQAVIDEVVYLESKLITMCIGAGMKYEVNEEL